jgi:hypothetical protein
MTAFPDMRLVMDEVLVQGNRIEYHWTLIGTNTGPGGAGHRVRIRGFEVWQIGADGHGFCRWHARVSGEA